MKAKPPAEADGEPGVLVNCSPSTSEATVVVVLFGSVVVVLQLSPLNSAVVEVVGAVVVVVQLGQIGRAHV